MFGFQPLPLGKPPEGGLIGEPPFNAGLHYAYGLWRLVPGYSGNAIRVARSSDWFEQTFSFQPDGTLDTAAILSFVGAGNDGHITRWWDQVHGGTLSAGTVAFPDSGPKIVSGGSLVTQGGKPAAQYGVNTVLQQSASNPSGSANTFFTSAVVYTHNSPGSNGIAFLDGLAGGDAVVHGYMDDSFMGVKETQVLLRNGGQVEYGGDGTSTGGRKIVTTCVYPTASPAHQTGRVNGVALNTWSPIFGAFPISSYGNVLQFGSDFYNGIPNIVGNIQMAIAWKDFDYTGQLAALEARIQANL